MAIPQGLTEWLQQSRLVVVSVDPDTRRLRVRGAEDECTDLACGDRALIVSDEITTEDLSSLNPGDIVRVDESSGLPARIVVLRRVWEELASPEL